MIAPGALLPKSARFNGACPILAHTHPSRRRVSCSQDGRPGPFVDMDYSGRPGCARTGTASKRDGIIHTVGCSVTHKETKQNGSNTNPQEGVVNWAARLALCACAERARTN